MNKEEFSNYYSNYFGEIVDNPKQIVQHNFNGEELFEMVSSISEQYSNTQNALLKKELEEAKEKLKKTEKHLRVLISGFDGIHEARKEEYGNAYPEDDFVINAKEFINHNTPTE